MASNDKGRLLTVLEAAQRLGIARKTLYRWLTELDIRYVRLGRVIRIPEEEVELLVEINTVNGHQQRKPGL